MRIPPPIYIDIASIVAGPFIGPAQVVTNAVQAIYQSVQLRSIDRFSKGVTETKGREHWNNVRSPAQMKRDEHISNIAIGLIRSIPVVGGVARIVYTSAKEKIEKSDLFVNRMKKKLAKQADTDEISRLEGLIRQFRKEGKYDEVRQYESNLEEMNTYESLKTLADIYCDKTLTPFTPETKSAQRTVEILKKLVENTEDMDQIKQLQDKRTYYTDLYELECRYNEILKENTVENIKKLALLTKSTRLERAILEETIGKFIKKESRSHFAEHFIDGQKTNDLLFDSAKENASTHFFAHVTNLFSEGKINIKENMQPTWRVQWELEWYQREIQDKTNLGRLDFIAKLANLALEIGENDTVDETIYALLTNEDGDEKKRLFMQSFYNKNPDHLSRLEKIIRNRHPQSPPPSELDNPF